MTVLGGAKKKSLAQMEKAQLLQDKKAEEQKKKSKALVDRKARGMEVPDIEDDKFLSEISKLGAITPYSLASQYNLRLSVAKNLLSELERKRYIRSTGGNARIRIYKLAAA